MIQPGSWPVCCSKSSPPILLIVFDWRWLQDMCPCLCSPCSRNCVVPLSVFSVTLCCACFRSMFCCTLPARPTNVFRRNTFLPPHELDGRQLWEFLFNLDANLLVRCCPTDWFLLPGLCETTRTNIMNHYLIGTSFSRISTLLHDLDLLLCFFLQFILRWICWLLVEGALEERVIRCCDPLPDLSFVYRRPDLNQGSQLISINTGSPAFPDKLSSKHGSLSQRSPTSCTVIATIWAIWEQSAS